MSAHDGARVFAPFALVAHSHMTSHMLAQRASTGPARPRRSEDEVWMQTALGSARGASRAARTGLARHVGGQRSLQFAAKRVALLLLGEAFRSGVGSVRLDSPCNASSLAEQREATLSYVQRIAEPIEQRGGKVDILFTFPKCAEQATLVQLRSQMTSWLQPRVRAHATIRSASMTDGWQKGYDLLRLYMAASGARYDYVLQARHDVYIEKALVEWPSNFSRLLFELPGRDCKGGCQMGGVRDIEKQWPQCRNRPCHADHMMWVPQRFLPQVFRHVDVGTDWGHDFMNHIQAAAGREASDERVPHSEVGFMFPGECSEFDIDLVCNEWKTYRPRRSDGEGRAIVGPGVKPGD